MLQNMKLNLGFFLVILTILTIIYSVTSQAENITKEPYAITPYFPGLKYLYSQLQNSGSQNKSQLNPQLKWDICKKIFNKEPPIFSSPDESHEILLDPRLVESMLKEDHRYKQIFYELYEKYRPTVLKIPIPGRRPYRYVNRSILRLIFIDGNVYAENTFLCIVGLFRYDAKNKMVPAKRIIRQYYVSDHDYNMNEVSGGKKIVGRFVFFYDQDIQYLVVHALAEESPPAIEEFWKVASSYLERRYTYKPTSDPRDDPICRLDEGQRLRICNSVLMETQRMTGGLVLLDNKCVKRPLRFRGETADFFEEWTIGCRIVPLPRYHQTLLSSMDLPIDPKSFTLGTVGYGSSPAPSYFKSPTPGYLGSPTPSYLNSPSPSNLGSPTPSYLNSPTPGYLGSPIPSYPSSPNHPNSPNYTPRKSDSFASNSGLSSPQGSFNYTDSPNNHPSSSNLSPLLVSYVCRAYADNEVFILLPDPNNVNWMHGHKEKIGVVRDRHDTSMVESTQSESEGSNGGNGKNSREGSSRGKGKNSREGSNRKMGENSREGSNREIFDDVSSSD